MPETSVLGQELLQSALHISVCKISYRKSVALPTHKISLFLWTCGAMKSTDSYGRVEQWPLPIARRTHLTSPFLACMHKLHRINVAVLVYNVYVYLMTQVIHTPMRFDEIPCW